MAPRKKRNSTKKSGVLEKMIDKTPKKCKKRNSEKNKSNLNDSIQESVNQCTVLSRKTQKFRKKKRMQRNETDKNTLIWDVISQDNTLQYPETRSKNLSNLTTRKVSIDHLELVLDENVLDDNFIPLTIPMKPSQNCEGTSESFRTVSETVVSSTSDKAEDSVAVIVVDDDDDNDSVCIEEIKDSVDCESINDSVQIITNSNDYKVKNCCGKNTVTTKISPSKTRKFDDSIEILESDDFYNIPSSKKSRHCRNVESSSAIPNIVILEPCDSDGISIPKKSINHGNVESSLVISSTITDITNEDETQNICKQDDDIVIVDSVVKKNRDCVMVLSDPIPARTSPAKSRRMKRTTCGTVDRNFEPMTNNNPCFSSVLRDTVGNAQMFSARYKSPLTSILNQDSDPNVPYHNVYGNNMYNPNSVQKTGLRPVIIDGSNVAFGHGGKRFSVRGIEICVNYFLKRGHNVVIAFVPKFRRSEVTDVERKIFDDLENKQQLRFTPSRFLHGRCVSSYDDRFIVQCAAELGGVIVSTDNYRDLVSENEAWRETIEKRLLMFTWVGDILMFPDDPNGRGGPRLKEFLKFP